MNVPKNLVGCRGLRMNIRQGFCLFRLRVSRRMDEECQAEGVGMTEFLVLGQGRRERRGLTVVRKYRTLAYWQ
jgi:hypothetical protein